MDLARFDQVREQLSILFKYVKSLREENRQLKRRVYSLERSKSGPEADEERAKRTSLIEERDRLVMERELVRKRIETIISKLDEALRKEEAGAK